ncbi:MAG TPA: flagellar biosynthesis protein FliQ [bacterium]|jgi:flagellar biosynthetic protein FliQ|nr:flagellar biosynthesis protein FliQ [Myxococcales bacterium]OQA58834.1 MAG: Flagellar biosynthetic protein FliQ [bacterium ADurb.Bin270]HPW45436.1 flagellar biosynthesis protein FliQ [bacterium]HQC50671.1 flagellar biosynthesis protein FliQ [bacterium]HQH80564.1 flagellar biosynthesis protein FliQ [bacterium]
MPEYFIGIAKQALFLSLILTGPPVMAAMLVGLVISILQATTQIQEQTLTFVPKLFTVVAVLAIAGPWMLAQMVAFTSSIFDSIPTYIH